MKGCPRQGTKNSLFSVLDHLQRSPWSLLPLEATLVSMVHCPRFYWTPRFLWMSLVPYKLGVVLMSVARVTTEGCPLSYSCRHPWHVLLPESKVIVLLWATAEGYAGGPFKTRGPCWCLFSVLPSDIMLRSIACTETEDHVDAVLAPENVWKSMIHVPGNCKGQGNYFCGGIDGFRCSWEIEI